MTPETFIATLKHDRGMIKIKIVSLSGRRGALQQLIAVEGCPESAIVQLTKKTERTQKNQ